MARAPPTCPFCRFEIGAERVEVDAARHIEIERALAGEAREAAAVHV